MLYPQHIHHYVSWIIRFESNLRGRVKKLIYTDYHFLPYNTVLFRLVWNHIHSSRHLPRRHISFQNNHSWELSGWRLSGKKSIDESLLTLESCLLKFEFQALLSMYWNIFHCILESIFWSSRFSSSYWTTCTIWNGRPSWSFKKVAPQR